MCKGSFIKLFVLSEPASTELEDHVDCAAGLEVVVTDLHLIGELLSTEDETDLTDLDTFLLLKSLLDLEDGVV